MKACLRHSPPALLLALTVACVPLGSAATAAEPPGKEAKEEPKRDLALGPVPWVDGERLQFTLTLGNGVDIGTTEYRAVLAESNGRKLWRVGARLFVPGHSLSWVDTDAETFLPITSTWKHALVGEATATFKPREVQITKGGKKEVTKIEVTQPVYDNEQAMHLMRRLPLAVGYQSTLPLVSSLGGATVSQVGLEVKAQETIEVPAGKFECFKVVLSIGQTFWFSTDAHRYLVKLEAGGTTASLTSIAQRIAEAPVPFRNDALGLTFTAPPNWVLHQPAGQKPDSQVIHLLDPRAEADSISLRLRPTNSLSATARTGARAWADAEVTEPLKKDRKDFKVRADGWKTLTVSGREGVSLTADYGEKDKRKVLFAVYALGRTTSEQFVLTCPAEKSEALKTAFETIVGSYQSR